MIAVCGEALIDFVGRSQTAYPGGGPFNTARALARLAVPTTFLGRLSTDSFGRELASLLAADGVDLSMATTGPEPTTIAIADVDGLGLATYSFRVDGTSAPNLTASMLRDHLPANVRALHVGTLGLLLEPIASTVAGLVEREGSERLVMVDPNIRPALLPDDDSAYRRRLESVIGLSTVVKASEQDLAWLYPGLSYEAAAHAILGQGRVRMVVATLGERGAYGAVTGVRIHVKAPRVDVVDTIGAGDAFGAALLAWLHYRHKLDRSLSLSRDEVDAALNFASLVGSITCTRRGADPPRRDEVGVPDVKSLKPRFGSA